MLLRHRPPPLKKQPGTTSAGYEYLDPKAISVLRWLGSNRIEFVLVGPVAYAIRGDRSASGPAAIVPAPYARNFERLSKALFAAHARLRVSEQVGTVPFKLTGEKLSGEQRWTLRCGEHDIDIEGRPDSAPRYQELLYEAGRFELAPDLSVEVASPEDLEHYASLQRSGIPAEIRITRSSTERNRA